MRLKRKCSIEAGGGGAQQQMQTVATQAHINLIIEIGPFPKYIFVSNIMIHYHKAKNKMPYFVSMVCLNPFAAGRGTFDGGELGLAF